MSVQPRPLARFVIAVLLTAAAVAQQQAVSIVPVMRAAPGEPSPPADAVAPGGSAPAGGPQSKLLQRWRQLVFDRRPSAILQAWVQESPNTAAQLTPAQLEQLLVDYFSAPAPESEAAAAANDPLEQELKLLQRDVTLGRWAKVGAFLGVLPEAERKGAYEHLLQALPRHPQTPETQRLPLNLQERNRFSFADALGLAGIAPGGFDKAQAKLLAPIVRLALDEGSVAEELVRQLQAEVAREVGERRLDRRAAALLLCELSLEAEVGDFLPTAEAAERDNDREALNLLARHALAQYQVEQRRIHLETAWRVTQAALAAGEISEADKTEALRRAVELAPKVRAELGPQWLAESFTSRPERGMEILATIGSEVSKGFETRGQDPDYRKGSLKLQKTAVEALLRTAPELADRWRPTLGLLATGWIVEAAYSHSNALSDSRGRIMQRDEYGNIFWVDSRRGGGAQVRVVEPGDLLEAQPGPEWAGLLDAAVAPHFATVSAQLHLKVNEPEQAFPYIEQLAQMNPRKARELAHEFLRVWMRNNNPNTNTRTSSYMFMFGFDQRANAIPLTRSKQERNLQELGSYVERLRQLPIGGVDGQLLSQAFVAAHSSAEVFRLETIERVFGEVGDLDPVLLGGLLGTMRTNLATVWRRPAVQEQQKTRRTQREMLAEVARGYQTALAVAQDALQRRGRHWALLAVVASILHDQNNFARELGGNADYSAARQASFELFADAARHYAEVVGELRVDEETLTPFDAWFYSALGAADLGAIDEDTVVAVGQFPRIRAAIDALPDGARERHLAMFANQLFNRMSAVKPQIKYRYLDGGFAIVGDHPQAVEARRVWDYYQDLIRELRLEVVVEGSTAVGTAGFGVRVDIVHSPEIERESGGFQKFATNQNNQPFSWNYGRPLENYRDKFQEGVTQALGEQFEVLSVTFNSEDMQSKPDHAPGWRRTPYAWLLLRARGPQVDRIPVVKLDFDFLDTSGYAVLPIGSAPVAIDAAAEPAPRPWSDLEVSQLLDERRADEGRITLEIKAKAKGLVPDLEAFLALDLPGFAVDKRTDHGAAVVQFAADQDTIESERVWLLSLVPERAGEVPRRFLFGRPREAGIQAVYQRYNDADLEMVDPELALASVLDPGNPTWAWMLLAAAFLGYFVWFFTARIPAGGGSTKAVGIGMPQQVTPFTVMMLLQEVLRVARLDEQQRAALVADIRRIEASHFGRVADPTLDIGALARDWLRRAC